MVKCSFCGLEEQAFKGIHLIQNDGQTAFFCSGKCRKNALKLKRDKRRMKWTESYHSEKSKKESKERGKK